MVCEAGKSTFYSQLLGRMEKWKQAGATRVAVQMDSTQENLLVLLLLLGVAALGALVVGTLSSRTLREEGLRRLVKRWLGR